MIYLASPYTHEDQIVREERARLVAIAAGRLMLATGEAIYSPITHGHAVYAEHKALPLDWEFWRGQCFPLLDVCDSMAVLMLEGYENSVGINAEVDYVKGLGKEVRYYSLGELKLMEDAALAMQ